MTLAELLRTQRKFPEAEAELERAIALNPDAEEPYLTLAPLPGRAEGVRPRAERSLLRLAERQPRLAQAQFLLGRLAIETESWDEAIARLTAAVELDPDHDGALDARSAYVYAEARPQERRGDRGVPARRARPTRTTRRSSSGSATS